MEDDTTQQGARPKQSAVCAGGNAQGFGEFCLEVESFLTRRQSETLATWFGYPLANIDKINNSDDPSRVFVQFMVERGEISHTDISSFIRALKSETVHLNGIAANVEEAFEKYLGKTSPSAVTDELKEKARKFKEQLKTKYQNLCGANRPVPYLHRTFSIDKLYVESGAEFLEDSPSSKGKWLSLKSCRGIVTDPRVKSKRRLLEGAPGFGKSAFALRTAHDWVNNHESMKDIEILILLRLRHYRNVSSVYSAIKRVLLPKESKLSEEDIEEILQTFKSSTMFIFDGYDEYPDRMKEGSDINLIIKGDMFPDCEVILTSRPGNFENAANTWRIRLTGFNDTARDAYIEKVVTGGDAEAAKPIKKFFAENPVSSHLCHVPLFFVMVAHMTHWYEQFKNITTVTKFLEKIVACLYSHEQMRETGKGKLTENHQFGKGHRKLNELAYDGLNGQQEQMTWKKYKLIQRLGQALYDGYVRVGILVEEEIFDVESCVTETEASFWHKLFQEWFAAHYIAESAAQDDVVFEPWSYSITYIFNFFKEPYVLQPKGVTDQTKKVLKCLHPSLLTYMYQFACGLNSDAAVKIIEHLSKGQSTMDYILLCIKEWGGNLEYIWNAVTSLCSSGITMHYHFVAAHEEAAVEVLKFASRNEIPVLRLVLACLDFSVLSKGILHLRKSNLPVPVVTSLEELQIWDMGVEITEEGATSILKYTSMCRRLEIVIFHRCLLPRHVEVPESFRSSSVTVLWVSAKHYILNLESGEWEGTCEFDKWENRQIGEKSIAIATIRANRGAPMSDQEYDDARSEAHLHAKNMKAGGIV